MRSWGFVGELGVRGCTRRLHLLRLLLRRVLLFGGVGKEGRGVRGACLSANPRLVKLEKQPRNLHDNDKFI